MYSPTGHICAVLVRSPSTPRRCAAPSRWRLASPWPERLGHRAPPRAAVAPGLGAAAGRLRARPCAAPRAPSLRWPALIAARPGRAAGRPPPSGGSRTAAEPGRGHGPGARARQSRGAPPFAPSVPMTSGAHGSED